MSYRHSEELMALADFCARMERINALVRWQNIICAWILGSVYLIVGEFYWCDWRARGTLLQQALWFLVILAAWPVLLILFKQIGRLFRNYPRCPACGKKLYQALPALLSKRCPHCHAIILRDHRGFSPGYELPLTIEESMNKKTGYSLSMDMQGIADLRIPLIAMPLMLFLIVATGLKNDLDLELMMSKMLIVIGGGIVGISGIAPLISVEFLARVFRRLYLLPRNASAYCPTCGKIPRPVLTRVSGCCSECGVTLLEMPDELDTPDMIDWRKLKQLCEFEVFVPIFFVALFWVGFMLDIGWFIWFIAAWFVGYLVIFSALKRRARIPSKCPHCARPMGANRRLLLNFGRCSRCQHKLVLDNWQKE